MNPSKTTIPNIPSPWATAWGEDAYGYWQAFEVKGIRQVMRWIPAGEFTQGSPTNEAERGGDEIQRHVTISQGFWLADTACTQALWQAVMADNPSHFKGEQLPVETISWDDCQAFLEALQALVPALAVQFPTEAQWEYACRAGTTSPFNWGDATLSSEQANFDGGSPYADNSKSEYRQKTVEVYRFSPNAWGLYQMHGNVYEWCADWYGQWQSIDPQGPSEGDWCVLRGGSCSSDGERLRTAHRDRDFAPDSRCYFIGLRIATGEPHQPVG